MSEEFQVIYLEPLCEEWNGDRDWCEDANWEGSIRYVLGTEFDRVTAERDALQQLLNQRDEQVESLKQRLQGEPVAWEVTGGGVKPGLFTYKPGWAVEDPAYEVRALTYAEQPAPVAVVLPDLWQPIETAPKDGTEIILRKSDRVTSGAWTEWSKAEAEFHGTTGAYLGQVEYDSGALWSSWDGGFCDDDHPTHWQPLPTVTPQQ